MTSADRFWRERMKEVHKLIWVSSYMRQDVFISLMPNSEFVTTLILTSCSVSLYISYSFLFSVCASKLSKEAKDRLQEKHLCRKLLFY